MEDNLLTVENEELESTNKLVPESKIKDEPITSDINEYNRSCIYSENKVQTQAKDKIQNFINKVIVKAVNKEQQSPQFLQSSVDKHVTLNNSQVKNDTQSVSDKVSLEVLKSEVSEQQTPRFIQTNIDKHVTLNNSQVKNNTQSVTDNVTLEAFNSEQQTTRLIQTSVEEQETLNNSQKYVLLILKNDLPIPVTTRSQSNTRKSQALPIEKKNDKIIQNASTSIKKTYPCEKCTKKFCNIDVLSDHMLRFHKEYDHFLCLHCNFRSFDEDIMKKHIEMLKHQSTTEDIRKEEPLNVSGSAEEANNCTPLDTFNNKGKDSNEIRCKKAEEINNCAVSTISAAGNAEETSNCAVSTTLTVGNEAVINFENEKDYDDRGTASPISMVSGTNSDIEHNDDKVSIENSPESTIKQEPIIIFSSQSFSEFEPLTKAYLDGKSSEKEETSNSRKVGQKFKRTNKVKKANNKKKVQKPKNQKVEKGTSNKESHCLNSERILHQTNDKLHEASANDIPIVSEDNGKLTRHCQQSKKIGNKPRPKKETKQFLKAESSSDLDEHDNENAESNKEDVKRKDIKESYECEICHKVFMGRSKYNRHLEVHLPSEGRRKFVCGQCDKTFVSSTGFKFHKKTHIGRKENICEVCGTAFYQIGDLRRHMLTHSKEDADRKKCVCPECGKSFSNNSNLQQHMYIHKEARFVCDVCGKGYAQLINLKHHLKQHQGTDTEANRFPCKKCSKSFHNKDALIIHMMQFHKGKCPPTCEFCGKTFASNWKLTAHRRIHNNEKPFSCEVCDQTFKQATAMERHKIKIHKHVKTLPSKNESDGLPGSLCNKQISSTNKEDEVDKPMDVEYMMSDYNKDQSPQP